MRTEARLAAFGFAGLLVAAGVACALLLGGLAAALLAFIFISSGLVLATSLVFLEVGLSEDRAREREFARTERAAQRRRPRSRRLVSRRRGSH